MKRRIRARDQRRRRAAGDDPVALPVLGPAYEAHLARSAIWGHGGQVLNQYLQVRVGTGFGRDVGLQDLTP